MKRLYPIKPGRYDITVSDDQHISFFPKAAPGAVRDMFCMNRIFGDHRIVILPANVQLLILPVGCTASDVQLRVRDNHERPRIQSTSHRSKSRLAKAARRAKSS